MSDLPIGTVTFLYTDIEGSTRLWERQPQAMRRALQRHDDLLRQAVETHGGKVYRHAGDALCAAFPAAPPALAAAVEVQEKLFAENWQGQKWGLEDPLRVRMALHSAAAEVQEGDYVGSGLNRIGRLLPVGHGGQVLLTQATEQLGREHLPQGTRLLDLGQHRFRDLAFPERIFQLGIPNLPERFPPLKTLDAFPNNLPVQLTSFIGRERQVQEVQHLLGETRLLTLTGSGGTGKTRLALQAAASDIESFPDGAWLVELAPLADPLLVPQSLASTLNLAEKPGLSPLDLVIEYLSGRSLLLVLDNCEHLVEACAQLADRLLRACPQLKILASSREALGIAGEVALRVPSLSLPPADAQLDWEELNTFEAVCLFVERAAAARGNFTLTRQNAAPVAQICRRLDGVPLAIELAAARSKLFSVEQIATRLDDRFRLLTGGSRTALPRQQTLQAMIDWSYDLLSDQEQALFRRLSVFSGGWRFEAAETICSGESYPGAQIEEEEIMDLLASLVNKSLVLVDEQGEEARYRFLETVRQYASQKLLNSGEAAQARAQHLAYFAVKSDLAKESRWEWSPQHILWLAWVKAEIENLRQAQEWAMDHDLGVALRLIGNLGIYWSSSNHGREFLSFERRARERAEKLPEYSEEGSAENQDRMAFIWAEEAGTLMAMGDNQAAFTAVERGIQIARRAGSVDTLAAGLSLKALIAQFTGNMEAVNQATQETLSLARQGGIHSREMLTLILVSRNQFLSQSQGYSAARDQLLAVMRDFDQDGNPYGSAMSRMTLGMSAKDAGEADDAEIYLKEALALFHKYGEIHFVNICNSGLADVAHLRGDYPGCRRQYQDVLKVWVGYGNRGAVARCLECMAFSQVSQWRSPSEGENLERLQQAVILLGAASKIREESRAPMTSQEKPEYEGYMGELHELLPSREYEAAWEAGERLDFEQAVALASSADLLA